MNLAAFDPLRAFVPRRPFRSDRLRRAYVWAATVWFAIVTSGVPLPAGMSSDKFGAPFPCQSHACGCRSAAACWTDCCCFTLDEKLAWARANGVTPPAGTPLFDPEEKRSDAADDAPPAKRSCCAKKASEPTTASVASGSCCSAQKATSKQATCCSVARPASSCGEDGECEEAGSAKDEATGIVLLQAMKCRGVATSWTGTGQPFVPALAIEWTQETTVSALLPAPQATFASCRPRYVGPPG
jgi:hypothetical protein